MNDVRAAARAGHPYPASDPIDLAAHRRRAHHRIALTITMMLTLPGIPEIIRRDMVNTVAPATIATVRP